jgi:hypothetical protein
LKVLSFLANAGIIRVSWETQPLRAVFLTVAVLPAAFFAIGAFTVLDGACFAAAGFFIVIFALAVAMVGLLVLFLPFRDRAGWLTRARYEPRTGESVEYRDHNSKNRNNSEPDSKRND